jgi:hypothetical protein
MIIMVNDWLNPKSTADTAEPSDPMMLLIS